MLLHGTRDSLLDLQLISLLDIFIVATKRFSSYYALQTQGVGLVLV